MKMTRTLHIIAHWAEERTDWTDVVYVFLDT